MADSLVSFVEQRAGDSLRAVAEYNEDGIGLLYSRDDLNRDEITERINAIHDNITWEWNPSNDTIVSELGEKRATLHVHEGAVIIHLLEKADRGYLVGLEPEAARDLTTFLGECLSHIE